MPEEFIRAAATSAFHIGPKLATGYFVRAHIPPPRLKGMNEEFVYRPEGQGGTPDIFPSTHLMRLPPSAELPVAQYSLRVGRESSKRKTSPELVCIEQDAKNVDTYGRYPYPTLFVPEGGNIVQARQLSQGMSLAQLGEF